MKRQVYFVIITFIAIALAAIWALPRDWRLEKKCLEQGGQWDRNQGICELNNAPSR